MTLWLALACTDAPSEVAGEVAVLTDLSDPVDECDLPCIDLSGPEGTTLRLTGDGELLDSGEIGADGLLSLCPPAGSLTPDTALSVEHDGEEALSATLDVRPFGHAMGREVAYGAPDALSFDGGWVLDALPFLRPEPGTWYGEAITSPHRAGDTLYFSGKSAPGGAYWLGAVDFTTGEPSAEPLIAPSAGDWDHAGQVSPTRIETDAGLVLLYQGLGDDAEVPVLGRATSEDGLTWSRSEGGIYGDTTTDKVSHPTALVDDAGLVLLWHLTHDGPVGMSLSDDGGQTFTRSCVDLPMRGKSPEVAWVTDRYVMTWATQEGGEDVVRLAESLDGLRWLERDAPILRASDATWTANGLSNAQLTWIDDTPHLLLVGVMDGEHGFGLAAPE